MTAGYYDPTGIPLGVPRPVGPARCVELIRGLTSESRDERTSWAGAIPMWGGWGELTSSEAAPLAAVLAWATLLETDVAGLTRTDLLDSLDSLAQVDEVPPVVLVQVTSNLSREDLDIAEVDSYDVLVDKLRESGGAGQAATGRVAVGPARCVRVVRGLTSLAEGERATWAGVAAEWVAAGELAAHEAGPVAAVLGWAGLIELPGVFATRQRLLSALALLAQRELAPTAVLEQVTADLARGELDAAEAGCYDVLVEQLRRRRGPGPPARVARCLELLRGLTSQYADQRAAWAVTAREWLDQGELAAPEAGPIAAVLGWAARLETEIADATRARLLDALTSAARAGLAPAAALEQVATGLPRDELHATEAHAFDVLVDRLRAQDGLGEPGRIQIGAVHGVRLVRGIVTQSPHWAGVAGEWVAAGTLDTHEATTIATVLGWAALLEPSDTFPTRQRVLYSLTLLAQHDLAPTTVLEQVTTTLHRHDLNTDEAQHYDTLVDQLRRRRSPGESATA